MVIKLKSKSVMEDLTKVGRPVAVGDDVLGVRDGELVTDGVKEGLGDGFGLSVGTSLGAKESVGECVTVGKCDGPGLGAGDVVGVELGTRLRVGDTRDGARLGLGDGRGL